MDFQALDGSQRRVNTVLFTSGSSGKPKAVLISTDAFVNDIAGNDNGAKATSQSLTVSYIPLSHSSDRYKVWEHLVHGGRVGFCFYAAHHWEAHEQDKKDAMIEYSSPVQGLLKQVQALRPTSMACPPNIWSGLRALADASGGSRKPQGLECVARLFGGRLTSFATGGAPTPSLDRQFALDLCQTMTRLRALTWKNRLHNGSGLTGGAGAVGETSFSDSYGTTEAGAIASDGYRLGPKFAMSDLKLLDHPDLGFTSRDIPHPRGEVAIRSGSLAIGYWKNDDATAAAFVPIREEERPSLRAEERSVRIPMEHWCDSLAFCSFNVSLFSLRCPSSLSLLKYSLSRCLSLPVPLSSFASLQCARDE